MNWINLPISIIRAPEYVGSEPVERATWLNLLAYCAEQENGGRIAGARLWKDRQWQQTCGVTLAEVGASGDLWSWDGDDLVIWGYPDDKEAEVVAKRQGGAIGGKKRAENARARKEAAELEAASEASRSSASGELASSPSGTASTEEKRKEENGREGERNERAAAPAPADEPAPPPIFGHGHPLTAPPRIERPPSAGGGRRDPSLNPSLTAVQQALAVLWPSAPKAMTGQELHDLHGSLPVLTELSGEDWMACGAWNAAPLRVLNRQARWPRDRSEFVRNAGQAVELIRGWWHERGGKRWRRQQAQKEQKEQKEQSKAPASVVPFPQPAAGASQPSEADLAALDEFLKIDLKPTGTSE